MSSSNTNFSDVERNKAGEEPTCKSGQQTADDEQLVAVGRFAATHGDGSSQGGNLRLIKNAQYEQEPDHY